MSDKDVIDFFAVLMIANFVIDFSFLWWEYFETLDMVHFGFPFFKVREVVEFVNYPVENDNITAFHFINFTNFLFFPMVIDGKILVRSSFLPSIKILNVRQQFWWQQSLIYFIKRGVSKSDYKLSFEHLLFNQFYRLFTIFRRNQFQSYHPIKNGRRRLKGNTVGFQRCFLGDFGMRWPLN